MKRRSLLVGTATVATAALAGCIGSAQTSPSGENRTLRVNKSGEVAGEPDLAVVSASIEATGQTAGSVRDELSTRSDALYDGLIDEGLGEDSITTGRFSIRERLDRRRIERREEPPETDAELEEYRRYEGTHSFRIEVSEIESVGAIIDTAVDSGADSIDGVVYTLSDEKQAELREDALESAIAEARSEAEFVASEIDASIVEVESVDTSDGSVSPVRRDVEYATAADSAGGTELRPDDVTVRATASVTYRIG